MSANADTSHEKPLPLTNLFRWMIRGEQGIAALLLFIILATMATQVLPAMYLAHRFRGAKKSRGFH